MRLIVYNSCLVLLVIACKMEHGGVLNYTVYPPCLTVSLHTLLHSKRPLDLSDKSAKGAGMNNINGLRAFPPTIFYSYKRPMPWGITILCVYTIFNRRKCEMDWITRNSKGFTLKFYFTVKG